MELLTNYYSTQKHSSKKTRAAVVGKGGGGIRGEAWAPLSGKPAFPPAPVRVKMEFYRAKYLLTVKKITISKFSRQHSTKKIKDFSCKKEIKKKNK